MKGLFDILLPVTMALVAFFAGWIVALLPCLGSTGGVYCSAHGGLGVFVGLLLGLVCAVVGYRKTRRALRRSRADD